LLSNQTTGPTRPRQALQRFEDDLKALVPLQPPYIHERGLLEPCHLGVRSIRLVIDAGIHDRYPFRGEAATLQIVLRALGDRLDGYVFIDRQHAPLGEPYPCRHG
jgi:hypothetical protein